MSGTALLEIPFRACVIMPAPKEKSFCHSCKRTELPEGKTSSQQQLLGI
jgi:hypothetical protein